MQKEHRSFWDYIAVGCALVVFAPMFVFLFDALAESSQLRDAIVILICGLMVIGIEQGIRPNFPKLSTQSITTLFASYSLVYINFYVVKANFPTFTEFGVIEFAYFAYVLLTFAAFATFLASLGFMFFTSKRYVVAISGGFFGFSILSMIFQFADLPLRVLAGRAAGYVLSLFGDNVSLLMYKGEVPQIALQVNEKSYLVATECNGFGIISSCLVLSIVMALFRKSIPFWCRATTILGGILIGFLANTVRIVAIVSVSLMIGNKHYYFYHEALGYLFFAIALVATWKLSKLKR